MSGAAGQSVPYLWTSVFMCGSGFLFAPEGLLARHVLRRLRRENRRGCKTQRHMKTRRTTKGRKEVGRLFTFSDVQGLSPQFSRGFPRHQFDFETLLSASWTRPHA